MRVGRGDGGRTPAAARRRCGRKRPSNRGYNTTTKRHIAVFQSGERCSATASARLTTRHLLPSINAQRPPPSRSPSTGTAAWRSCSPTATLPSTRRCSSTRLSESGCDSSRHIRCAAQRSTGPASLTAPLHAPLRTQRTTAARPRVDEEELVRRLYKPKQSRPLQVARAADPPVRRPVTGRASRTRAGAAHVRQPRRLDVLQQGRHHEHADAAR